MNPDQTRLELGSYDTCFYLHIYIFTKERGFFYFENKESAMQEDKEMTESNIYHNFIIRLGNDHS